MCLFIFTSLFLPPCRTIVALVYNVLKTMMQMNSKLFDELTNSYKADKQKYVLHPPLLCCVSVHACSHRSSIVVGFQTVLSIVIKHTTTLVSFRGTLPKPERPQIDSESPNLQTRYCF